MPLLGLGQDTSVNRQNLTPSSSTGNGGGTTLVLSQPFANTITPDIAFPLTQPGPIKAAVAQAQMSKQAQTQTNGLVTTAIVIGLLLFLGGD